MSTGNKLQIIPGYIQGAFDGEGYLSKTGHDRREWWVLGISNCDLEWLEAIAKYLTAIGYHPGIDTDGRAGTFGNKPCYSLRLRRRGEIRRFLTYGERRRDYHAEKRD